MARVTVEDCLKNLRNRFELVLVSSKRARQIARGGAVPRVPEENDKPTVIALREIAEEAIDVKQYMGEKIEAAAEPETVDIFVSSESESKEPSAIEIEIEKELSATEIESGEIKDSIDSPEDSE